MPKVNSPRGKGRGQQPAVIVGVTGSFGSGKTTVAAMFRQCGALVVDADAVVHRLFQEHAGCRREVGRLFGRQVLTEKGVDRSKLARIVFSDMTALRRLEGILHPLVWREIGRVLRRGPKRIVVIDAPLLLEAGWQRKVDVVVVVQARLVQQVARIRSRAGLGRTDVLRRIRCQMPLRDKLKYADFVVDNSGAKTDTYRQVKRIWDKLKG